MDNLKKNWAILKANYFSRCTRRWLPHLAGIVLLYGTAAADDRMSLVTSFSYPSGGLLRNGSFENNYARYTFEGWTISHSADNDNFAGTFDFLSASNAITPYNGRKMLAVRFKMEPGQSPFLVSDAFPMKPNTHYTFLVRYRAAYAPESPAGERLHPTFITYRSRDILNPAEKIGQPAAGNPYDESAEWTLSGHRFQTGPEGAFAVIGLLHGGTASTSGDFYFDDAYLVEGCVRITSMDTGPLPNGCDDVPFGQDPRHPDFIGVSRKFLDGNNKVVQTVVQDGLRDIVTQNMYDELGRIKKTTLPIGGNFSPNQHAFIPNLKADHTPGDFLANFYNPNSDPLKTFDARIDDPFPGETEGAHYPEADGFAFSQIRYEDSPLGREKEAAGAGAQWAFGSQNTVRTNYTAVSNLADAVENTLPGPPSDNSGDFSIQETIGADEQVTRAISDRFGKLVRQVAKLTVDGTTTTWLSTDYEYDANGNLNQIEAPADASARRLTSTMKYDILNRMISDSTPVTGVSRYLYDNLGRVRLFQSARQADSLRFSFIKYDPLGRVLQTGEVLDESLFTQANADIEDFPCAVNCPDPSSIIPASIVKFRTLNHYDTENARLTCQGDLSGSSGGGGSGGSTGGAGEIAFLAENPAGAAIVAGYDLLTVYQTTLERLQGETGESRVLAIYDPDGETVVAPPLGTEFDFQVGDLAFTFEGSSLNTQAGMDAWETFLSLHAAQLAGLLGPGDFLHGRLVKTLSCNYELAAALGESVPREVSKTYRYDKFGNVSRVMEVNRYVRNPVYGIQLVKNEYDVQNRLTRKILCGNASACDNFNPALALNHMEQYQYDQLGRMRKVLDKAGNTLAHNHYNYIGQLSAQGLGADLGAAVPTALTQRGEYHLQGWGKKIEYNKRDGSGTLMFREELGYESGASGITPRFDGNISSAQYTYASSTTANVQYVYAYDDLNRLMDATSNDASATTAYDYLDDGRISFMGRGSAAGAYSYDTLGRLEAVAGNLVDGRDMSLSGPNSKFTYDANGNLVKDRSKMQGGQPLEISYRDDNLPYKFEYGLPNSSQRFTAYMAYDETGNRVSKIQFAGSSWESSKNYFALGKEVREREGSVSAFSRMAGLGRVRYSATEQGGGAGFKEFYLRDHLGSTRGVYSAVGDGGLVHASRYFPYGKPSNEFNSQAIQDPDLTEKYTGKEFDSDIDLMYFGARFYDPDLGIWISPDPAREFHSLYSFSPDPINSFDPDGRDVVYIYNGPTKGNPFGHTALAVTGHGTYSYGQNQSDIYLGMSLKDYLRTQEHRRSTTLYYYKTTPEQDKKIMDYLHKQGKLPGFPNIKMTTCETRTACALNAGDIEPNPMLRPIQWLLSKLGLNSFLPGDGKDVAETNGNLVNVELQHGDYHLDEQDMSQFEATGR